jgi:hypothetical protein
VRRDEPHAIRIVIIEADSESALCAALREIFAVERNREVYIGRIGHMGDINNVSGQVGAVGSNASSSDDIFMQLSMQGVQDIDLIKLATQLEMVRMAMRQQVSSVSSAEQDDEIGHVAAARIAAQKGDKESVIAHLKQVTAWTLKVAKDAGAEIVALTLAHLITG